MSDFKDKMRQIRFLLMGLRPRAGCGSADPLAVLTGLLLNGQGEWMVRDGKINGRKGGRRWREDLAHPNILA